MVLAEHQNTYSLINSIMKFSISFSRCFSIQDEVSPTISMRGLRSLGNTHEFSYNELKIATNGFRSSNKMGEGGFGSVYQGILENGMVVAVKVLSVGSKQGDDEFMSEIASMSTINHENLVKLHGGCIDGDHRMLVYEYMANNSLYQAFLGGEKNRVKFTWEMRRNICLGIARGIAHVHEEVKPSIVHRDIKASNILLDQNFNAKVSDFGLSRVFSDNITHISTKVAGTLGYLAPEYAVSGQLTRKSDVYSFGVLVLEIVTGRSAIDFNLELGEHHLVEKAWEMYKDKKLLDLVDPTLRGQFSGAEAVRFLEVGLLCVQEKTGLRPRMSTAIKLMTKDMSIEDVEIICEPGLITDIMNVKIGRNRSPFRAITGLSEASPVHKASGDGSPLRRIIARIRGPGQLHPSNFS